VITLAVFVPWVLATFGRPARGRLHWLVAGAIGGLIVLTYQAWLVFGGLGVAALIVRTWRAAEDRRRYLLHLVGVAVVAVVVASWYVLPYLYAMFTRPSSNAADVYVPGSLLTNFLPFLSATPLGVLQLVGLAGLVSLRRVTWWATPLLLMTGGVLLYLVLATLRFSVTGHTMFLHYSTSLCTALLIAAGVLTLAHVVPAVAARLAAGPPAGSAAPPAGSAAPPAGSAAGPLAGGAAAQPAGIAAAALAVVLAFVCYSYSGAWTPASGAATTHYAAEAHLEALPGGGYPRFGPAKGRTQPFPADAIRDAVQRTRGPDARPVTLTVDERLFAFLPWTGYTSLSRGAAGSLVPWARQQAEVHRLTQVTDPARFAQESADTEFGPIDVFVLRRNGTRWMWRDQVFTPGQFNDAAWSVAELPDDIVVATRR
jgi:hypothetical protein